MFRYAHPFFFPSADMRALPFATSSSPDLIKSFFLSTRPPPPHAPHLALTNPPPKKSFIFSVAHFCSRFPFLFPFPFAFLHAIPAFLVKGIVRGRRICRGTLRWLGIAGNCWALLGIAGQGTLNADCLPLADGDGTLIQNSCQKFFLFFFPATYQR